MFPPYFEIFLYLSVPEDPNWWALWQAMGQVLYKTYYMTYEIFFLWWIKSVLKRGKISKYYLLEWRYILLIFVLISKFHFFSYIGESAVGKSSLVLRFVKGQFHEYQESTIGGEISLFSLKIWPIKWFALFSL